MSQPHCSWSTQSNNGLASTVGALRRFERHLFHSMFCGSHCLWKASRGGKGLLTPASLKTAALIKLRPKRHLNMFPISHQRRDLKRLLLGGTPAYGLFVFQNTAICPYVCVRKEILAIISSPDRNRLFSLSLTVSVFISLRLCSQPKNLKSNKLCGMEQWLLKIGINKVTRPGMFCLAREKKSGYLMVMAQEVGEGGLFLI